MGFGSHIMETKSGEDAPRKRGLSLLDAVWGEEGRGGGVGGRRGGRGGGKKTEGKRKGKDVGYIINLCSV